MDIDSQGESKRSPYEPEKNGFDLYPVSVNSSGEGLPYAPEDWPNPGDKWGWKVGKRISVGGHFLDRYIYLPSSLRQSGHERTFKSRLSLEQYIRTNYPNTDIHAFFSSFSWKIPSKLFKKDDRAIFIPPRDVPIHQRSNGKPNDLHCNADNRVCDSLGVGENPGSDVIFCDICCSEPDFCRDCCCILCHRTISKVDGGYNYIRCEANTDGRVCGHKCHIDCALRAYMAGTVGGSIGLNAEYYCRRCDARTDLVSHVRKLIGKCESIASEDDIVKVLKVCISVLRGSKRKSAKRLMRRIELTLSSVL